MGKPEEEREQEPETLLGPWPFDDEPLPEECPNCGNGENPWRLIEEYIVTRAVWNAEEEEQDEQSRLGYEDADVEWDSAEPSEVLCSHCSFSLWESAPPFAGLPEGSSLVLPDQEDERRARSDSPQDLDNKTVASLQRRRSVDDRRDGR